MLTINTTGHFQYFEQVMIIYHTQALCGRRIEVNLCRQQNYKEKPETSYSWEPFNLIGQILVNNQSGQKTNAITCNISTGNSTLFLPKRGRGWKSGDAS